MAPKAVDPHAAKRAQESLERAATNFAKATAALELAQARARVAQHELLEAQAHVAQMLGDVAGR